MAETKKAIQRRVMEEAFTQLGGITTLMTWAQELDKYGNMSNYGEFLKLFIKLTPAIKPDTDKGYDTQEGFIMGLIKADNILKLNSGKPIQLIDIEPSTETKEL
jgi:hypothetical protein